jgi:hypothetical protein
MGYGDNRYGDNDRWQGRERGGRWQEERENLGWGRGDRERGQQGGGSHGGGSQGGHEGGFFERAGEQVRSWFSDDDDRGGSSRGGGGDWNRSSESFGGGFGNQRGWGDDHLRSQGSQRMGGQEMGGQARGGGGMSRGQGQQDEGYAQGSSRSNWGGGGGGADTWGGSGFGGPDDNGRRFDRIDPGHVGAQGAHPMSSPVDAGYGGAGGSYGRSAAILASQGGGGQHGISPEARDRMLGRGGGQGGQQGGGGFGGGHHDPHYSEWRQRQIDQLDRDYHDYRSEHQSKFEQDFGGWREKRQTQRQSMGRVTEQMEVVGSDGEHVGTVDKVRGDRVILTKSDPNAGGVHHSFACSWIETVDDKVTLNKTAREAMRAWESEEQNRALFETGNEGSEGPHVLNRSFSGTYGDRNG